MKKESIWKSLLFWIPFLILITISLFLMYHSRFITEAFQEHFEKQCLWFFLGFLLFSCAMFVPSQKLFRYSFLFYLFHVFLLILVLFIGKDTNGSKAWIDLKYFRFQPSEFMKFAYMVFLAHFVSKQKKMNFKGELLFLLKVFLCFLIPSVFIFLEPDTGAILFLAIITLTLLFVSPIRKRWLIVLGIFVVGLIGTFFYCYFYQKDFLISIIGTSVFYRVDRLLNFRSGMQIENAFIAIGSAPFWRFSLTETGIYIPEAPTDFAFALTANVFGIAGIFLILLCFLFLDCYLISYIKKLKKNEQRMFATAFVVLFIANQWINISMNLGLFPIIGIPLPLISYGGSSTIVLFLSFMLLFSFTKKRRTKSSV